MFAIKLFNCMFKSKRQIYNQYDKIITATNGKNTFCFYSV